MDNFNFCAEAERSLAGCLLVQPEETVGLIRGLVSSGDFQDAEARVIFESATSLVNSGKPADPVIIQARAAEAGTPLDTELCAELMRLFCTTVDAAEHARLIHNAAIQRRAREVGLSIAADSLTPVEGIARLQELVRDGGSRLQNPADAANDFMDFVTSAASGDKRIFLPTGYASLDDQLAGGLVEGGLVVLAARPGVGKTTLGLNIADNVASAGGRVLYVSLEMPTRQVWACRAASLSGLPRSALYAGKVQGGDWCRLTDALDVLSRRYFIVRDIPSSMADIEMAARGIAGLSLLVVDHLGLIRPASRASRYEAVTEISHELKQLALSMKIPVLALCQLNRACEQRESRRPSLADLRDSGAIEEDADAVGLLFRPAQYLPDDQKPEPWQSQEFDVLVEKNRHGSTGIVKMNFCGYNSRIMEVN